MQSSALFSSLSHLSCFHSENNPLAWHMPTGTLVPQDSSRAPSFVMTSELPSTTKEWNINHAKVQCCASWNAKKNVEIFLAKWNILMSISHLKYSPNLLFLGLVFFLKQLHRGYGIWVGKEKYFHFLSLTLSGIDKNIKALWVLVFLGEVWGEHALYKKDVELCLFSFSCLSAWEENSWGKLSSGLGNKENSGP